MTRSKDDLKSESQDASNDWLALLNLGWLIAGNMALFVGGGIWIDRHYHTAPIFILVGTILGIIGCGYTIYKTMRKLTQDEARKHQH